jgi:proteasome lid subunit RPN8/RPN11
VDIPDKIILAQSLKTQILEHVKSSPEIEVCGLVGGIDKNATTVYRVKNIAEKPNRRFLMDPKEQINVMRKMREADETLWGIYHSHPETPAIPSSIDLNMAAYPDVIYLIASLYEDTTDLRCFYYCENIFTEIDLAICPNSRTSRRLNC